MIARVAPTIEPIEFVHLPTTILAGLDRHSGLRYFDDGATMAIIDTTLLRLAAGLIYAVQIRDHTLVARLNIQHQAITLTCPAGSYEPITLSEDEWATRVTLLGRCIRVWGILG